MVMKLTEVNADPAIIDIEIPELESFDFDSYFNLAASRSDYGTLIVAQGRETITHNHSLHTELFGILADPIYQITKKLWEMDKTRYPLFKFSDFEDFYKKNILDRQSIGILGTIDHREWSQPWHLDNRFIMISGSINIQDNETSTYFAKENYHWSNGGTSFDHCKIVYKGRKTKFTGTAWINTEHTWHSVPRIIEDQRKTILFNVFL
jgi:hypothetical protein